MANKTKKHLHQAVARCAKSAMGTTNFHWSKLAVASVIPNLIAAFHLSIMTGLDEM